MSESLEEEIRTLRSLFWSERDRDGRAFAPLADAYLRSGETKEALDLLTDGMSRHPEFTSGHVVAAKLYLQQGMHIEAEFAARRVLELDGENVVAMVSLAQVLEETGEADELARVRAALVQLDPESEEAQTASPEAPTVGAMAADDALPEDSDSPIDGFEKTGEPMELDALAPDAEPAVVEAVMELDALAPDPEPEAVEELMELDALAPDPEPEAVEASEPVWTRTLAELYVKQGFIGQALDVFRHLLEEDPVADDIARRIAELEGGVVDADSGETAPGPADAEPVEPADAGGMGDTQEEEVETLARDLAESGSGEHDVDTPFAWTEEEADVSAGEGPSIAEYFDVLFSWQPRDGS